VLGRTRKEEQKFISTPLQKKKEKKNKLKISRNKNVYLSVVVYSQSAMKNHAVALSLLPPPLWVGEENQKVKLIDWGKNRLTEQQREKKSNNNNTDKKNIQHLIFSPPDAQLAPE